MKARNNSNFISGWFLGYVITAGVIATDPLALFTTPTAEWGTLSTFSAVLVLSMALFTSLCFMFFAKPYVEVREQEFIVQNPFKIWTLPKAAADLVQSSFPYPHVRVGGRRIWLMSMEMSFGALLVGLDVTDRIPKSPASASAEPELSSPPRGRYNLTVGQIVLAATWIAYITLALILR